MKIKLSDHFTYGRLLRFTLPSVVMMVIASIYSVVDGLFVSNLVGDMALSAVNIIFPVSMIIGAFGFMLGTGGSAIVARTLGEGRRELAQRYFSMIIYAVILLGGALTAVSVWLTEPIARLAGASDVLIRDCVVYGRILLLGSVPFMLQVCFQSFFVVAERPQLGLVFSIAAGVTNMVLDYVLIAVFQLGIAGAAIATVLGYAVGGIIPLFYFATGERSGLRLTRSQLYPRQLLQACSNGSSELMSNISSSVISILYNLQLMRMVGELGVAAYSVMMYVDFVFVAAFLGFSIGSAPIVSYHYGARNHAELNNLYSKSLRLIGVVAVLMTALSMVLIPYVARIFVGYDAELLALTSHAFRVYALNFFLMGFNVYGSSFFTALGDGVTSALISFLRTLLFQLLALIFLPMVLGIEGVWLAVTVAEAGALCVTVLMFVRKDKVFHYRKA